MKHFWNQRVQKKLDRRFAKQLLDWAKEKKLAEPIPQSRQKELVRGVKELATIDTSFSIEYDDGKILVSMSGIQKELYIYPAMWNKKNRELIPNNVIAVSDKAVVDAMPYAYELIQSRLKM